jgi:serine/threonine protein phosphatase PrpC
LRLIRTDETQPGSQRAVWASEIGKEDVQLLGVWTEKRLGLGEDAEPTLLLHCSGAGMIGVYDGMGGAGARQLGRTADGRPISNAFAASRLAYLAVQEWYADGGHAVLPLADRLQEVLDNARPAGGRMLRGTIAKQLPTTIALIDFRPGKARNSVRVVTRWAGDSRCYLLTADHGLQQLTRDDSEIDDPLETLMADQPLTNHLAAGRPFRLNEKCFERPAVGSVLLCATDGFFGYVASPAMFEYHLLRTLDESGSVEEWGLRLADWRRGTAGDDATLALAAIGCGEFRKLRSRFRRRLDRLDREHAEPLHRLEDAEVDAAERRERLERFRVDSWARYRDMYMELMPGRAS